MGRGRLVALLAQFLESAHKRILTRCLACQSAPQLVALLPELVLQSERRVTQRAGLLVSQRLPLLSEVL